MIQISIQMLSGFHLTNICWSPRDSNSCTFSILDNTHKMERHGQVLDKKVVNNRQSTSGSELLILNSLHATNTFNKTELWAFAPLLLSKQHTLPSPAYFYSVAAWEEWSAARRCKKKISITHQNLYHFFWEFEHNMFSMMISEQLRDCYLCCLFSKFLSSPSLLGPSSSIPAPVPWWCVVWQLLPSLAMVKWIDYEQ